MRICEFVPSTVCACYFSMYLTSPMASVIVICGLRTILPTMRAPMNRLARLICLQHVFGLALQGARMCVLGGEGEHWGPCFLTAGGWERH